MLRRVPLRTLWRILREVDLEAIRRGAESRFQVMVAADDVGDARRFAELIGPHPWLEVVDASAAASIASREPFDLAVLVSRSADLSPSLGSIRDDRSARGEPVVTVIVAREAGETAGIPRRGESQRVVVPELDAPAVEIIAKAILAAVRPELLLALGRQLQGLRPIVFTSLIDETARANAGYAFTTGIAEIIPLLNVPMNIGDIVMLTKNQLVVSYKIALVAGKYGSPRHLMAEILGVLGGGFLFRQIARQLTGLVPAVGVASKVAVAYGGTWAIGRAVVLWATGGQAVTTESVRAFYEEGLALGRQAARALTSRRHDA